MFKLCQFKLNPNLKHWTKIEWHTLLHMSTSNFLKVNSKNVYNTKPVPKTSSAMHFNNPVNPSYHNPQEWYCCYVLIHCERRRENTSFLWCPMYSDLQSIKQFIVSYYWLKYFSSVRVLMARPVPIRDGPRVSSNHNSLVNPFSCVTFFGTLLEFGKNWSLFNFY